VHLTAYPYSELSESCIRHDFLANFTGLYQAFRDVEEIKITCFFRPEFFTNFAGLYQVVDEENNCTTDCTTTDSLWQTKPFPISQKEFNKLSKFEILEYFLFIRQEAKCKKKK
jgi:hypothetical protein